MMQKCKEIFLSIFTFSTEKKFSQVQNTDLKGYKKKMAISHTRGGVWRVCEFSHFIFFFYLKASLRLPKDVLVTTFHELSSCTKYRLELGAGPYIYRSNESSMSYDDQENEDFLLGTINKIWASQENSFRAFTSTLPVSNFNYWLADWEKLRSDLFINQMSQGMVINIIQMRHHQRKIYIF